MKAIKVIRVDFDNLENRQPYLRTDIGTFVAGEGLTPFGKISRFFSSLQPQKLYMGYDLKVYPQFELQEIELK